MKKEIRLVYLHFLIKNPFRNALVQSIAGGNTMVFNSLSANALAEIDLNFEIISHDWLCIKLFLDQMERLFMIKTQNFI